jgi:proline iminopeptidase
MDRRTFVAAAAGGALAPSAVLAAAVADVRNGRRTINGAELNYSLAGGAQDHPMIVLHGGRGYGTHGSVFETYLPLTDRYRLIGYDMRGHGRSAAVAPFTFDQMVDELEQVRLTLGGGRPMVLLGGSFGGMVALSYALKYPRGLSHLVLRGTAPSWEHEIEALSNFEARAALKAPMATKAMLRKVFTPTIANDEEFRLIMFAMAPMYVEDGDPVDLDRILTNSSRVRYDARVHNDLFADHSYDVVDRLHTIRAPTLVMCGDSDWICPPAQSRLIASKVPGSKLVIIPNSNHGVPGPVALREVSTFLAATA